MLTKFSLTSTPVVGRLEFANESAVGSPILPIPTMQICNCPDFSKFWIFGKSSYIMPVFLSVFCKLMNELLSIEFI